ncbi:MAG TPA: hypothetical protein VIT92_11895 [Burkholderiaceae bacterium]
MSIGVLNIPRAPSAAYLAAEFIFDKGPQTREALFAAVDFGRFPGNRRSTLTRTLDNRWLIETSAGIDISEGARKHFIAKRKPLQAPVGVKATSRFEQVPTTAKIPKLNPLGNRDDTPEWSRRIPK